MHVLVEGGELVDEAVLFRRLIIGIAGQPFGQPVFYVLHILQAAPAVQQRQVPADAVDDGDGIIQIVAVVQKRPFAIEHAQDELLIKPGHMTHFPQQGIYDTQPGADNLLVVEGVKQLQRSGASELQTIDQILVADDFGHGG